MKTIKKTAIVLGMISVMISCGKEEKAKKPVKAVPNTETKKEVKDDLNKTASKSTVVFTDDKINDVYNQYLSVKAALVNTASNDVQKEAKKLDDMLEKEGVFNELKATAKLIALTKDIKKQRDFFVTLTAETEKIIATADITSGEVYKQFCPMAFEGKGGYWLSDSKEVRNPYYGSQMLKCGSVKTTIN